MIVRPKFTVLFKPPLHQCRHAFLPTKPPLTIASPKMTNPFDGVSDPLIGTRPLRGAAWAPSMHAEKVPGARTLYYVRKAQTGSQAEGSIVLFHHNGGVPFPSGRHVPAQGPHASKPVIPLRNL